MCVSGERTQPGHTPGISKNIFIIVRVLLIKQQSPTLTFKLSRQMMVEQTLISKRGQKVTNSRLISQHTKQPGEFVKDFVADLHELVKSCAFEQHWKTH